MCCCDPKVNMLGIRGMSLGTPLSTVSWICVCYHSEGMQAQRKTTAVTKGQRSHHMSTNKILSTEMQRLRERDSDQSL